MVGKVLERDLERHFSKECKRLGLTTIKLHLKFSVGWPDRLVVLDHGVLWVELKVLTGKVSPSQQKIHQLLKTKKHAIFVLRTKESITDVLESASLSEKSRRVPGDEWVWPVVVGPRSRKD